MRERVTEELQIIGQQPWLKALLLWLPLLMFFALWWVFSSGTALDLPIGVVDLEQSTLSRGLIRYYDASPTLAVTQGFTSVKKGSDAMKSGQIYALVVIPDDLTRSVVLGHAPTVTTFYNSQFILIGKLVNSAMQQAQGTYNAQISAVKNMSQGNVAPQQALAQAVPIQTQITALFNSNSHYGQFLVSAAVPALWQIFIVATTVLSFAIEQRRQGVITWLGKHPIHSVFAKIITLFGFIFNTGTGVLIGDVWFVRVANAWQLGILLLGQILMVLACQSVGAAFFMLTQDVTRSMSFVAAFTAPAFAFMGVTFPSSDMTMLAQIWRNLLPVSHYIDVQIKQVNNGVGLDQAAGQLLALALFLSLLGVVFLKARSLVDSANRGEVK